MQKLISICIAAYNIEKYIIQCLDSILLMEANLDMEIIIVDDCSGDRTVQEIENFIASYE